MSRIPVYIDIECIPDQREGAYDAIRAAVKAPGQYKKPESIQQWLDENGDQVAQEEYLKTGLNGLYGEICAISYAVSTAAVCSIIRNHEMTEADLLVDFWVDLRAEIDAYITENLHVDAGTIQPIEWIGHNVIEFDLRFLKQRSIVNGIRPSIFIPTEAKHGLGHVFDTMKEWAGWRGYVSLAELAKALGIDGKLDGMTGADVWPTWAAGDFDKVRDYNRQDVELTRQIHRRMLFLP